MRPYYALLALAVLVPLGTAQKTVRPSAAQPAPKPAVVKPVPLPIVMPKDAKLTMEVDVRDSDIWGFVKRLLSSTGSSMGAAQGKGQAAVANDKSFQLTINGLLKSIHHVHALGYAIDHPDASEEVATQEARFRALGLRRTAYFHNESQIFLVMLADTAPGMAVVTANDSDVTVVRFDGSLDFGALAEAAGQAIVMYTAAHGANGGSVTVSANTTTKAPVAVVTKKPVHKVKAKKHVKK